MSMKTHKRLLYSRKQQHWDFVSVVSHIVKLLIWASITLFAMFVLPSAWRKVERAFRQTIVSGQAGYGSIRMKGGEFRQEGDERRDSLIRPGGSLSSDDLRRRLDELRTTGSRSTACCARNGERHYGKQ